MKYEVLKKIIIFAMVLSIYFCENTESSYSLIRNNSLQDEVIAKAQPLNPLITPIVTIVVAVIGTIGTILVAFNQNRKTLKEKGIEHNNNMEYTYSIDLRQRRLEAYRGLWELTRIKFDENSSKSEIERHRVSLSDWYYHNGQGMLFTEHSQKLFENFKENLAQLRKGWDEDKSKETDKANAEKRDKINDIKDIASKFRTSLLKDVGTRTSLKNLPVYNELIIEEPEQVNEGPYENYIRFTYAFFGNEASYLKNNNILYIITNLDKNVPIFADTEHIDRLAIGERYHFKWYHNLSNEETRGYSIRITISDIFTSERKFKYPVRSDNKEN